MLRLLLRLVLALVAIRFFQAFARHLAGGAARKHVPGPAAPKPPKPIVDRSSAIDVPFTEER